MPMEHIRQRMMQDTSLYPGFGGPKSKDSPSVISVSSSSGSSSAVLPNRSAHRTKSPIVISSDEEDELPKRPSSGASTLPSSGISPLETPLIPSLPPLKIRDLTQKKVDTIDLSSPVRFVSKPTPIPIPSNKDFLLQHSSPAYTYGRVQHTDTIPIADTSEDNVYISPAEAEKAIRELMSGGMGQELETEINMDDAIVKGFRQDIKLLPHQVIGRAWMKEREDPSKKRFGGILADDMGLGKTIQTLTRIVEGRARKSDRDDGWAATTLVVCPLALVEQWADEITKMAEDTTVLKHHGSSRTSDPTALRKFRVVVTTYDVVKSEYEAYMSGAKDESHTKLSSKKNSEAGSDDDTSSGALDKFGRSLNVKEKKTRPKSNKKSALFGVKWWRVVLDEAHSIKNVKTKGAISCCELEGKYRWCLTGTPMQNSVDELYSLFKFLRIKPYSNWTTFNEHVAKPVKTGRGAIRAMKRLQVVLNQIMLRRQKDQTLNGKALLDLPKRTVSVVSCEFDSSEKAFYAGLENKMESVIKKLMRNGQNNYISVLLLLLRLRQACNHPVLVAQDYKSDMEELDPKAKRSADDDDTDILVGAFSQLGVTRKCRVCTTELNSRNAAPDEPEHLCLDCVPFAQQAKQAEKTRPTSAKIRMILKLLADVKERSRGEEKTIIFSQFTKMLDLIEPFLKDKGIKYVRYDGSMDLKTRNESLQAIKTVKSVCVILISFKAGSTGLNLTACNNVILVDLWWNPALEDQAFDRAHRLGQKRDVHIFKLKIDETVEDRILTLQEKKRELARAALSGDKIKNMRLGMDDLLALFRPGGRDEDEED
ncbi:hypothetical protein H2248_003684 [Termitomyces sp. 'cryptogamus']|nr:hypothetical protein H2248_003684 [Termitomyces sp. 'cryptogamus']